MTTIQTIVTAILLTSINTCYSQTTEPCSDNNPIDLKLKICLDSTENYTTYGMLHCTGQAMDLWDNELNKYYKLLMSKLNDNEKNKLRTSQRKWLEYRDAEFATSSLIYDNMQGTMWTIVSLDGKMQIVKERALSLKSYYSSLTLDK